MREVFFTEPNAKLYPDSDSTVLDVAEKLEGRYKIIEQFVESYSGEINNLLEAHYFRLSEGNDTVYSEGLFNAEVESLFTTYIMNVEHGIVTGASMERGNGLSFVDTGNYLQFMRLRWSK